MTRTIRTIVVDDERHARQKLRALLSTAEDVEIIRECRTAPEAIAAIREAKPDLVFLDVQMPGGDGFDVLAGINGAAAHVIFVTAHDQYAVRAFEVEALDYLLKPFDRKRLTGALQRVRERMRDGGDLQEQLRALADRVRPSDSLERIMVKSAGRITFLRVSEIDWIEAADNYVRLHAGREKHLIRETMNHLESRLDPRKFVRIHRSAIVNVDAVQEIHTLFHGDHSVLLRTGAEIPLGRSFRERLETLFGDAL
jgi:two-component system LytT family response regulator